MPVDESDIRSTLEELVAKYALETGKHLEDPDLMKLAKSKVSDLRDLVLRKEIPPLSAIAASVVVIREGRYSAAATKVKKDAKSANKRIPVDINSIFGAEEAQ